MAEFSLQCDELTHDLLIDGAIDTVARGDGKVTVSRFGVFGYYHFSTSHPSGCHWRVLEQSRPEIRLICLLQGQNAHVGYAGSMRVFSVGESNCSFVKAGCTQDITIDSEGGCELFMLVVGLSDISLPISGSQPHLRDFLEGNKCAWLLDVCNSPLDIRQTAVIQQILHEKKPAYLQSAYMQLKLAELFVLFLEQADRFDSKQALARLRPDELDRIRKVGTMLHDHPAEAYSLVGLAHAVGTNEASLKKNFKAVYGTTVFGYLTACRMERAKILLANGQLKVAAVAQEVGYKYASHFSSAFRKYFGYLPNKVIRRMIFAASFIIADELESVCLLLAF
ncbi:helix-turn-helix transcriptional regulator [Parapedobacter tibetensis]|uniref:helix-turn-helix transcriptional regulator n=1 Tax=Parapedobacter tibetensis TaxID=2972951 RepID=UPI00214D9671|nr:AraC family transcriptional regulator [Parapedobacter tibetensis]